MRVAFTGKGGSGKSTLAALFIDHLQAHRETVLAVDADINVHLPDLLGVCLPDELALSRPDNVANIRAHLLGSNTAIGGVDRFIKTTPPGPGSNLVTVRPTDPIVSRYGVPAGDGVRLMHVGTYQREDIGASCYHGSLAVLENLLSHTVLGERDWIVCDMVAGTDAFSNSLHVQFDLIVVVVEPTPEAVAVADRYHALAEAAGVDDVVVFLGNKLVDEADRDYLRRHLGAPLLAGLPVLTSLRRVRQAGERFRTTHLEDPDVLAALADRARARPMHPDRRRDLLRDVHLKLAEKDWVRLAYGDVRGQLVPVGP